MSFFGFFLFIAVVLGGFVATVVALVYRTFYTIASGTQSNSFKALVARMKSTLDNKTADLVPWESDTLGLLCAQPLNETTQGIFIKTKSDGLISTIFQEPVAVYSKSFLGDTFILMVRTKTEDFLFRKSKQQTEVWLNERPFCVVVGNNILSGDNSGKLLGQLTSTPGMAEQTLSIKDSPIATLVLEHQPDEVNPRAILPMANLEMENLLLAKALAFNSIAGSNIKI
jgi:hypothetical protein